MLKELIKLFEYLKGVKISKFSNNNYQVYDEETKEIIREKLEEYKTNIFALVDLEKYFGINDNPKNPSYITQTISMIRTYVDNPDEVMPSFLEQKIRNDEHTKEILFNLEGNINGTIKPDITYAPVLEEIEKLDYIIDILKENGDAEYIDEGVMELIKDYLKNEVYISYDVKFVRIWQIIANYNIEIGERRTRK